MLILKSFFRKKTTKLYSLITTLLLLILSILIISKDYYLSKNNDSYNGSYIKITSYKNNKKIEKIPNIKEIKISIPVKINNVNFVLLPDSSVDNNTIIISDIYENLIFKDDVESYSFKVLEFNNIDTNFAIINDITFENILKSSDNISYIINLKIWAYYKNTIKDLEKNFSKEKIVLEFNKNNEINYESLIVVFNIFIIFNIILFLIIYIITVINIIEDEKNFNILYKCLGFKKSQLILLTIVKNILVLSIGICMCVLCFLISIFLI